MNATIVTLQSVVVGHILPILFHQNLLFWFLFAFRYLRLVVHIIAFWRYRPSPISRSPSLKPRSDCTVVIPTLDPDSDEFIHCLKGCIANKPKKIYVVTVGKDKKDYTRQAIDRIFPKASRPCRIRVFATKEADKRKQIAYVFPKIKSEITVLADDHVFWPSKRFLKSAIAPFEDHQVGFVGTHKRVIREDKPNPWQAFWNIVGALYLERHNFELRATNAIDGGVFVISGRTSLVRTSILKDPLFIAGFTNERFFFGMFGPLKPDDDNFITRWMVNHDWKIKFQWTRDTLMETTLGTYPKFLSQCLRWVRTTWRSNPKSLFVDRKVWWVQPWCVYAVYITSFFNFALFYDAALLYTLTGTDFYNADVLKAMCAWIFFSKMVKISPYFWRNKADVLYIPFCILFAYYHSLIKLYAMFTFWNCSWGGRNLDKETDPNEDSVLGYSDDESDTDDDLDREVLHANRDEAALSECSFPSPMRSHGWNPIFKETNWRPAYYSNNTSQCLQSNYASVHAAFQSQNLPDELARRFPHRPVNSIRPRVAISRHSPASVNILASPVKKVHWATTSTPRGKLASGKRAYPTPASPEVETYQPHPPPESDNNRALESQVDDATWPEPVFEDSPNSSPEWPFSVPSQLTGNSLDALNRLLWNHPETRYPTPISLSSGSRASSVDFQRNPEGSISRIRRGAKTPFRGWEREPSCGRLHENGYEDRSDVCEVPELFQPYR